jgi:hypothetical protein
MTLFGKILVVTNVILSLFMASVAIGIYTNRLDWPGVASSPAPGEKGAGEFGRAKAELDDIQRAAALAQSRYDDGLRTVAHLEDRIPRDRNAYALQLKILDGEQAGQIQVISPRTGAGQAALDDDGVPVLVYQRPAKPLKSRRGLYRELAQTEEEIHGEKNTIESLAHQQEQLTIELNGIPGRQKGLRDLLAEEKSTRENALAELQHLKPLRYNSEVESELLHKRQESLLARLNELRSLGMFRPQP